MREAEELCDEIAFLRGGLVQARGEAASLKRQVGVGDLVRLAVEGDWRGLAGLPGVAGCHGEGGRVECAVDDAGKRLPEILRYLFEQGVAVSEVRVAEPGLESVFLELSR
jgi:ABC-type multidrug transport system ATPase subunit